MIAKMVLFAALAVAQSQLFVQIRPEVDLRKSGAEAVLLRIRLAPGARGEVWAADSCALPKAEPYVILQSGSYTIPYTAFGGREGASACVVSSDGILSTSLQL